MEGQIQTFGQENRDFTTKTKQKLDSEQSENSTMNGKTDTSRRLVCFNLYHTQKQMALLEILRFATQLRDDIWDF